MYLRTHPEATLGQAAVQVFQCTVDAIILDDFLVGDYRLRPSHYEKLMAIREFAKLMKNAGKQMSVSLEGFTDNTGKEVMNKGLSVSRAAEMQNFLVRVGVDVHNVVGSGESNPRASNATEAGRRKNRRVEIRVCVLVPPSPGGIYRIRVSDLLKQVGYQPATLLAGAPGYTGFGDASPHTLWRAGAGSPSHPSQLRFFNLDQFSWNESKLTPGLKRLVDRLAEFIRHSWTTMSPVGYLRLTGHTDNTGPESFNRDLGNRRANEVKQELEMILGPDIRSQRIRIALVVEPSPGKSKPIADNLMPGGRAQNRRVEVVIEPPQGPGSDNTQQQVPDIRKIPDTIEDKIRQWDEEHRYFGRPNPNLPPGKSPKAVIDDWLKSHDISEFLRNRIWDAVIAGNWGLLSRSLDLAGIGGPEKGALMSIVQAALKAPAR